MGRRRALVHVRHGSDDRGAAAVEAALIICFLILPLTFGMIGYGYMLSFRQAMSQAAAEGARAAAVDMRATTSEEKVTLAEELVTGALGSYGVSCEDGQLRRGGSPVPGGTCVVEPAAACSNGSTCARVTVAYPYRDQSLLPSLPGLGILYPSTLSYSASVRAD